LPSKRGFFGILYEDIEGLPSQFHHRRHRRTANVVTFKSTEDLANLPPSDPAFPTVKNLVDRLIAYYTWEGHPYDPDRYGYTILIQEGPESQNAAFSGDINLQYEQALDFMLFGISLTT
jgi:hypothetical protein